jgi:hypothetical protein
MAWGRKHFLVELQGALGHRFNAEPFCYSLLTGPAIAFAQSGAFQQQIDSAS